MRRIVFTTLLLIVATSALAIGTADTTVVIPVIGRFPGANLTQWQTDVFLGNPSTNSPAVTLTFYSATGPRVHTLTMAPYSTVTLRDIVLNTYGSSNAAGPLEVTAPTGIEARARIYNVGNAAGEFGQSAPGLGKSKLGRQSYIYGLSGIGGNRVNIGVMNPNDTALAVGVYIADRNNVPLYSREVTVGPHSYVQYNDIFGVFGITPQDGVAVQFNVGPAVPIYGYASEVRNDTGDAVFLWGTSPNTGPF